MAQWEGKSRGTVLGYKIFILTMRYLGIGVAYFILNFVAFYFLFFSRKGTKASHYYFHERRGYSYFNSFFKVFQNNYKFGQTIVDKTAIASGLKDKFTYDFDGIDNLKKLFAQKQGGILISGHVGNFEMAEFFFKEINQEVQINLVVSDQEHKEIKDYLGSVTTKSGLKFIAIKEDFSHIFEIHNALNNNEVICFTGDRYIEGTKTMKEVFLGKKATFPAGPFLLASRLKVPVIFVYVMKETNKHYHLYARIVEIKKRDAQDLLKKYATSMEEMLEKYPLQWFNFFNFWNDY